MNYDKNNIFAKIIRKEIKCNLVYEDDAVIAFHDIAPKAKIHVLVLPKGEFTSFHDFVTNSSTVVHDFFVKVQLIAEKLGLVDDGYRILSNHGKLAGQTVPHFHVHILGGNELGDL